MPPLLAWIPTLIALLGAAAAWGAAQTRLDTLARQREESDKRHDEHRAVAEKSALAVLEKLDKILSRSEAHELRIARVEGHRDHDRERFDSMIEATRDALERLALRVDALDRAPSPHRTRTTP